METTSTPNVIREYQVSEDEQEMLFSREASYGSIKRACPWCESMTLTEDTYGYEKVVSCSHCEYSESKTL